jgi:acetolactate synthase-1/2/3 large subunit
MANDVSTRVEEVSTGSRNGADGLVAGLVSAGVTTVFGLPGVHNLAAWKSLSRSPIRLVSVRHEQTAAYAADGYARVTGDVGVALTTTGPGATNTITATGEAWASRSPIVVIATDIPSTLRRPGVYGGVLHESTDQAAMFEPVVKGVVRVTSADEMQMKIATAIDLARTAPARPVYVEIPTDILSQPTTAAECDIVARCSGVRREPDPEQIEQAIELIQSSASPLIWAGGGAVASDAGTALAELALKLSAPVLTTYQGKGIVDRHHPCSVGLLAQIPEAGDLWDAADLVIGVGTDFDGMTTQNWRQPAPTRLITINVDPADATKNYKPDVCIDGDARRACEELAARLGARSDDPGKTLDLATTRANAVNRLAAENPGAIEFVRMMESLASETIVVADMCIAGYWLGALYRPATPRRLCYPVGWGTLGFALPAAIGAAASGQGPVVSVSGDGGVLYALGELGTAAQEQLPMTIVIVDDGGYGMLRFDQINSGNTPFGVDLVSPDFVAVARGFGLRADHVKDFDDEFDAALRDHVSDPRPTVLVVSAALNPPPTTTPLWYRPKTER